MQSDSYDVAIVGAGLAGSSLAAILSQAGVRVALVDPHEVAPPDFRAEKLTDTQIAALERLGLAAPVLARATAIAELAIARRGEVVEQRPNHEYGLDYADLVAAVRSACPPECRITGRVGAVEATANRQTVTLGDGRRFEARLLVLATGLGQKLLQDLGIRRVPVAEHHCLAVGFDIDCPAAATRSLTFYGQALGDRSAYLTLFPIGARLRTNLFLYRRHDEAWAQAFRDDPRGSLLALMPELARLLPDFEVRGPVVLRPIHLTASEGHVRDGAVLIGDAFATTCPTGGTGIDKALTDVERLAALVPDWLATPGLGADKVRAFYDDPIKRAADRNATRMTAYARGMALDPSLVWAMRRTRNFYVQKLRHWARRQLARGTAQPPSPRSAEPAPQRERVQ